MIAAFALAGGQADGSSASGGFLGFLVFFALALAVWFLVRNMTGRLRRMNYAESQRVQDAVAPADAAEAGPDGPEAPQPPSAAPKSPPGD